MTLPEGLVAAAADARPIHPLRPAGLAAFLDTLPAPQAAFLRASGFAAKFGETGLLPAADGLAGAVLGLGESEELWAWGAAPLSLPPDTAWQLADPAAAAPATLGWALGAYRFTRYAARKRMPARLVLPEGAKEALILADSVIAARDLINTPAADLGPDELVGAVEALAACHNAQFSVIGSDALAAGFPALFAVGAGSPRAPKLAILEWDSGIEGAPLVALCGKGVCFDTGGLDLKPSAGMLRMKKDMGGAAIMVGLAAAIMRARLPIKLILLVGAVENSISGCAMRPMDVLRTRKGLTVEIGNTDAEGRLVLADLLAYAAERNPAVIIDAATLTGAARVALGPDLPALFCNDPVLGTFIRDAALSSQDGVWQLPLHDGYDSWLENPTADLSNVGSKPLAGAVTAALFLRRFVPPGQPWAHLDVYGWNDAPRPGRPEGGEAQTLRAVYAALAKQFGCGLNL
ncbi:leucyl aminopeptidase family protein [Plastoroseomonas arctica]|uniref:Leucyl aminopeptidase family protein n=1 Tax=Plastoroseomonas arctica TaxID=1509237 RepID=A0AAF1KQC8_9PROT|nr:leucyl aminopeptidase family protein [Plastoroseomonas arctica]MBR0657463.1 leucyl aminopeptidase family protein [Plastoroseomonas arctica]